MRISSINVVEILNGEILSLDSFTPDDKEGAIVTFEAKLEDNLEDQSPKDIKKIIKRAIKEEGYENQDGYSLQLVTSFA